MKSILVTLLAFWVFAGASAQGYRIEDGEVKVDGVILFETGSARLKAESDEALGNIKKYLDEKSYISLLRIEGHVDGSSGDQDLSEARANAVARWLVGAGVDCKRVIPVGFGAGKPVSELRSANTRVSFVNAALRGRAIGGMPVDGGGKVAGDPCVK